MNQHDEPLRLTNPILALRAAEKRARSLGLAGQMSLNHDSSAIVVSGLATVEQWIAWRDQLDDEITTIRRNGFGKLESRYADGELRGTGIPVGVIDPTPHGQRVIA